MPKRVLDVGQCDPDHGSIRRMLETRFAVEIDRADTGDDALEKLRAAPCDLVLVNRKLDIDYTDGMAVIERIKADPALAQVPVMLVTNYPEHQQAAVAAGAEYGFGKKELSLPATHQRLAKFLAS